MELEDERIVVVVVWVGKEEGETVVVLVRLAVFACEVECVVVVVVAAGAAGEALLVDFFRS